MRCKSYDHDQCNDDVDSHKQADAKLVNVHAYVDLGLPSGVKWATCNIGASLPEECGNYYAWGEVETKSEYLYEECVTYEKSIDSIDGDERYDVARAYWGETWRIPTQQEFRELIDNCTWVWDEQKKCYNVIGKNGNCIILPATGWYYGESIKGRGEYGTYWSATSYKSDERVDLNENIREEAYYFYCDDSGERFVSWGNRGVGRAVRPVCDAL